MNKPITKITDYQSRTDYPQRHKTCSHRQKKTNSRLTLYVVRVFSKCDRGLDQFLNHNYKLFDSKDKSGETLALSVPTCIIARYDSRCQFVPHQFMTFFYFFFVLTFYLSNAFQQLNELCVI